MPSRRTPQLTQPKAHRVRKRSTIQKRKNRPTTKKHGKNRQKTRQNNPKKRRKRQRHRQKSNQPRIHSQSTQMDNNTPIRLRSNLDNIQHSKIKNL